MRRGSRCDSARALSTPSKDDIELAFYERFLLSHGLEPYPVQEQAFERIFAGESVLVTVPTGTGKTLMAKAAIFKALSLGQKAVYTTPLRALTEEKYRELCEDFGAENVGFATGDFKENRDAPIQVEVAEILWNRIFGDRIHSPADVIIMDEGHYFNDEGRGHVWEQSIIGLDPRAQLVVLSATVGHPERFCHWVELTRRIPMALIDSRERRVPLHHAFREEYLIEVVRSLNASGDVPAIVFVFGREKCFEAARLLKSCRRFTSDEEKERIEALCDEVMLESGAVDELRPLLIHGIGIHHAGILPRYKRLVEEMTLARLIKFVVCTETIAAGINLPAKTVVFPSLRKYIRRQARLVVPAEFHQMAGRAGRPQFDTEGLAIVLAPEEVVQDMRKETKNAQKKGHRVDEDRIRKGAYSRARADAQRRADVIWDETIHQQLVQGEPAELRSKTRITAEQVLTIGLPDLTVARLPGAEGEPAGPDGPDGKKEGADGNGVPDNGSAPAPAPAGDEVPREPLPAYMNLNIVTVVDNLLLTERERQQQHKLLVQVTDNLRAIGVIDEHGRQVAGEMVGRLHGLDGLFVYYTLMNAQLEYDDCRALVEFMVEHNVIQRMLDRKDEDKRREWIRERLRERRRDNPLVSWEDVEEEYERNFPRELSRIELIHQEFCTQVPHPQLHGGKVHKNVWAQMEDQDLGFLEFVDRHRLAHEEGSLFSYLIRVMNFAKTLGEVTLMEQFTSLEERVRRCLSVVDIRLVSAADYRHF